MGNIRWDNWQGAASAGGGGGAGSLSYGVLAPIIGGTSLGNGLAIGASVTRFSDTLKPTWNWLNVLVENPQILAPKWNWIAVIGETMTYPKTGKVHTVRSQVRLVSNSND